MHPAANDEVIFRTETSYIGRDFVYVGGLMVNANSHFRLISFYCLNGTFQRIQFKTFNIHFYAEFSARLYLQIINSYSLCGIFTRWNYFAGCSAHVLYKKVSYYIAYTFHNDLS